MMPDEMPPTPAPPPVSDPAPETVAGDPGQPPTKFEIGEEFGTAKKNLPPAKIILIGVAIILVVGAVIALLQRPKTEAIGSIDDAVAAEIPGQSSVMAAINISIENQGKDAFKIHNIKVDLETATGNFSDEPASAVDLDRYFQALPELKKHAMDPLPIDTVIAPGATLHGTIVVSFPIASDVFASRKSLKVTVWPYHATVPLVLAK
jgi:hypothetical protein